MTWIGTTKEQLCVVLGHSLTYSYSLLFFYSYHYQTQQKVVDEDEEAV